MDIFISQNNSEVVVQLPVMPTTFTVNVAQNNEVFNSMTYGELKLIGVVALKKITFSSFFPKDDDNNAPYIRSKAYFGFKYVDLFESMAARRLPVRIIITGTKINMAATIDRFEYSIGKRGDIDYTMELSEFKLIKAKGVKKI